MNSNVFPFPNPEISDKHHDGDHTEHHGNGSNGGGGDMEARVAKLETHVEYIRRDVDALVKGVGEHRKETAADFRILFGALITTALGLAAIIAKGFHWF
ncbi:hypothetical protein ACIQVE_09135 [Pseudomonas sp. NPDC098747]|uniref:hypothetical protein n=1 Tax=Pseudomonas sp. NPDC098747 TaxID=3364487 RepID=UPI00383B6E70